jgi:hypothetical protein
MAQPDRPLGQLRLDNTNKHQYINHLLSPELGARQHNGSNALSTLCDSILSVLLSGVFFHGSANLDQCILEDFGLALCAGKEGEARTESASLRSAVLIA